MPIPGNGLEGEVVVERKVALHRPGEDGHEHDRTHGDVEAVETGQHIEGRTVRTGLQRQVQLGVGMVILVGLQYDEEHTQGNGRGQTEHELFLVIFLESPMGPGHGSPRGEQDQGIDRRDAPGPHSLEMPSQFSRSRARPIGDELIMEQFMGNPEIALSTEPGQGNYPDVVEGTEETQKEKDFGGDEPEHALTEGSIDLLVVLVREVFLDYLAEPAVEHDHQ